MLKFTSGVSLVSLMTCLIDAAPRQSLTCTRPASTSCGARTGMTPPIRPLGTWPPTRSLVVDNTYAQSMVNGGLFHRPLARFSSLLVMSLCLRRHAWFS
ncbi:hypothetical protein L226DRAFT_529812 [Lentinus tigrinus ALCF2SS1-7]|uniref:Secreted protein n=1 Tax=Lentinus tigrinus ALCF2SS1-6 TaxID=1328759 RepID=A0A5C2SXI0_9APHY|nr:hypothetical protein L227DRAFT_569600 [Lentinus tigrinus ALCF2SS1-6]RPD81408.1 hypothetical protein L226DRAFT_529812 [Lentinus tigrinus ALCF2SS1-7]